MLLFLKCSRQFISLLQNMRQITSMFSNFWISSSKLRKEFRELRSNKAEHVCVFVYIYLHTFILMHNSTNRKNTLTPKR